MNTHLDRALRNACALLVKVSLTPVLAAALLGVESAGQTINELQELTVPDAVAPYGFGGSVSISGDRAIFGNSPDYGEHGAAYVFELGPSGWVQQVKLTSSDGAPNDRFGVSVATSGNRAIVGALQDDDLGEDSGSAYIFELGPTGWVEQAKLTASDGAAADYFGNAVSIFGDYAIVGSFRDDDFGLSTGAAYMFEFGPNGWVEQVKLTASDAAADNFFGSSVSISGDHAIVGAGAFNSSADSAYVFERGPSGWVEQAKLTASDGWAGDDFGRPVSISGNRAIVGATGDDDQGVASGSAYVFELGPNGWTEQAKLTASDGGYSYVFGTSVAISGDRAVVGARLAEHLGVESGAAYAFEFSAGGWVQQTKLSSLDGADFDFFGFSASISGNRAMIGAPNVENLGSVYAFELDLATASCAVRNGILGLNPSDLTSTSEPKLGTWWTGAIAMTPLVGQTTLLTVLGVGLGGPVEGVQVFGYELLALPTFAPLQVDGTGLHGFSVPSDPTLAGAQFTAQGLRIETTGGTKHFVLTNALDFVLGL